MTNSLIVGYSGTDVTSRLWISLLLLALPVPAATVHLVNLHGGITVRTAGVAEIEVKHTVKGRPARATDLQTAETASRIYIRVEPADGAAADLDVTVPYRIPVIAQTKDGPIAVEGFFPSADLYTDTGDLRISVPWEAMRLGMQAKVRPATFVTPKGVKFTTRVSGEDDQRRWIAFDRHSAGDLTYGGVRVTANAPGRIELADIPVPDDSPVKLPWQAPAVLDEILDGVRHEPQRAAANRLEEPARGDVVMFRSEVRIVNLQVAVFDKDGMPFGGLKRDDFHVLEDGVPQDVSVAVSEEAPFNLVLLLDLSGSTRRDRDAMKAAATRFLGIARPQDRVALYVLGNDKFHVISPLTENHQQVISQVKAMPDTAGGSPVYDTIVLAYAQELRQHAGERNALILISDGIDNQLHQSNTPSKVSFKKLREAADSMDMLFYPVFLDPFDKLPAPDWAKKAKQRLEELATATGGRLFPARSIEDLEPVYPEVAKELRSLYSVAYYPKNQQFDGGWRNVTVRVDRPGSRVRTRVGYYAR